MQRSPLSHLLSRFGRGVQMVGLALVEWVGMHVGEDSTEGLVEHIRGNLVLQAQSVSWKGSSQVGE